MKLFWGMSREELIQVEEGSPDPEISRGDTLMYHSELLGEKTLTAYTFASDKLVRAKYMLTKYFSPEAQRLLSPAMPPKEPPMEECFRDFDTLEKAIMAEHGEPDATTHYGHPDRTDVNELEFEIMANAIRSGQSSWYSEWKTKDTLIILLLRGEGGEIKLEIGFGSVELDDQR